MGDSSPPREATVAFGGNGFARITGVKAFDS